MSDSDKIFITSNNGYYNFYNIGIISCTGKLSRGVKAIKLAENEFIQSATIIRENLNYKGLLTISTSGKGKITSLDDFSETSRAVKGSQVMSLKDDGLAAIYGVPENQAQIYITADNKAILINTSDIPIQNRATQGIKIINIKNKETFIEIM